MIRCWLCREQFEQGALSNYGIECPSCLVSVQPDGSMSSQPGTVNVGIALARATDRLTKQLLDNADERALLRQGRNPYKP